MRLLVYGATPLGAYLSAHFRFLGQQVTWLADSQTVEAVTSAGGIQAIGARGRRMATEIHVTASPDEAFAAPYDAIFFVMQGYDTMAALTAMMGHLKTSPPIISLQRGIGNAERIASVYGAANVIRGALTAVIAHPILSDGKPALETVVRMPSGGVGLADQHPLSQEIAALLQAAYLPVVLGDGRSLRWSALLWQLQGNAIPALVDLPFRDVYSSPTLFRLEYRMLIEALGIIEALKIHLIDLPGAPISKLATQLQAIPASLLPSLIIRTSAPPSLRDELLQDARYSEAAYLNGAIALHAHDLKLHAPINHVLALTLQDIADRRAVWAQFRGNPRTLEALIGVAAGR